MIKNAGRKSGSSGPAAGFFDAEHSVSRNSKLPKTGLLILCMRYFNKGLEHEMI